MAKTRGFGHPPQGHWETCLVKIDEPFFAWFLGAKVDVFFKKKVPRKTSKIAPWYYLVKRDFHHLLVQAPS